MLKFYFFLFLLWAQASHAGIVLPGDEITLPPLLYQVSVNAGTPEDRLNMITLDHRKRQARIGEWLDFGDSLDLPARISAQVIQKENFMWVAGGVFQGKIGSGFVVKDDLIYDLKLMRGWMKVWIKPQPGHPEVRIQTDHGFFTAQEAEFWMSSRPSQAEIYLISGEVKVELGENSSDKGAGRVEPLALLNRTYAVFEKNEKKPRYLAKDWDPSLIEVKIAHAYPGLVKLAGEASREWEAGKTSRVYASYRKKGWRKAARLDPIAK